MVIIFTDLDGCLIETENFSFRGAEEALELIRKRDDILLVPVTSKTETEVKFWLDKLGMRVPFIPETGGAIFFPEGFLSENAGFENRNGFKILRFSPPLENFYRCLDKMKKTGLVVVPITDMDVDEIVKRTGLPREQALMAKKREFSLPFALLHGDESIAYRIAEEKGFILWKGGWFFHLDGSDKGRAVAAFRKVVEREYGPVTTIGIGDSFVDVSMLLEVDIPVLIPRKSKRLPNLPRSDVLVAPAPGPVGWNEVVLRLLRGRMHC